MYYYSEGFTVFGSGGRKKAEHATTPAQRVDLATQAQVDATLNAVHNKGYSMLKIDLEELPLVKALLKNNPALENRVELRGLLRVPGLVGYCRVEPDKSVSIVLYKIEGVFKEWSKDGVYKEWDNCQILFKIYGDGQIDDYNLDIAKALMRQYAHFPIQYSEPPQAPRLS